VRVREKNPCFKGGKMSKINILKEAEKIKKSYTPYHLVNVDNFHVFLGLFEGDYKKHKHPYDVGSFERGRRGLGEEEHLAQIQSQKQGCGDAF
jgi:hypothetical protein